MARILIVLTSHASLGDTGKATGFHFEELAVPYWAFRDAGHSVDLASIAGGKPPHDPESLKEDPKKNPEAVTRFLADKDAAASLSRTLPIEAVKAASYDAVFLPGGHGTMWDLPGNAALARVIGTIAKDGGAVGAVCHGPAGLLDAQGADGQPLVRGRRVNSFTDAEERTAGLAETVPFLLETRLREAGAMFEGGPDFAPYAVRDGLLVTGQNPASSAKVAALMLDILRERASSRAA
jgi:putative intracellular protease/amidase